MRPDGICRTRNLPFASTRPQRRFTGKVQLRKDAHLKYGSVKGLSDVIEVDSGKWNLSLHTPAVPGMTEDRVLIALHRHDGSQHLVHSQRRVEEHFMVPSHLWSMQINAHSVGHGHGLKRERMLPFVTFVHNAMDQVGLYLALSANDGAVGECDIIILALALLEDGGCKRLRACRHVRRRYIIRQNYFLRFRERVQSSPKIFASWSKSLPKMTSMSIQLSGVASRHRTTQVAGSDASE